MNAGAPVNGGLAGSWTATLTLFAAYTFLSVAGLLLIKRWLPTAKIFLQEGSVSSPSIWLAALGALAYLAGFLCWMVLLTRMPLGVAYPLAVGATLLLSVLAGAAFFGERLTSVQLIGSGLVMTGIALLATGL